MRKKINILTVLNGVGLEQDAIILKEILEPYYDICVIDYLKPYLASKSDMNIMLELVDPTMLNYAAVNILIPNPEWTNFGNRYKNQFNYVFAKTRDAERIFKYLGYNTLYTSFTSRDLYKKEFSKKKYFLHFGGKSETKNSDVVWRTWVDHADMPKVIFCRTNHFDKFFESPDNIIKCFYRFSEDEKNMLMNRCMFHVCTSQYEGFGHYIWEGKSVGAIVITTNTPPMNGFINNKSGFLVDTARTKSMNHAQIAVIKQQSLYEKIMLANSMNSQEIRKMQYASRHQFLDNDKQFRKTIVETIKNIL